MSNIVKKRRKRSSQHQMLLPTSQNSDSTRFWPQAEPSEHNKCHHLVSSSARRQEPTSKATVMWRASLSFCRRQLASGHSWLLVAGLCSIFVIMAPNGLNLALAATSRDSQARVAIFNSTTTGNLLQDLRAKTTVPVATNRSSGASGTASMTTKGGFDGQQNKPSSTMSLDDEATTTSEPSSGSSDTTRTSTAESTTATTGEDEVESSDVVTNEPSRSMRRIIMEAADAASVQFVNRARTASGSTSDDATDGGTEDGSGEESETALEQEAAATTPTSAKIQSKHQADAAALRQDSNNNIGPKSERARKQQLDLTLDAYAKWRATGDDVIELFSRRFLPLIMEHGYDVDAASITGVLQVFNGVRSLKPWALKLLDSWGKLTPGILIGTQSDFGDYDECLNVRVDDPSGLAASTSQADELDPMTGLSPSTVVGRYCLADVQVPLPPRKSLAKRNEQLNSSFAPIELRQALHDFTQSADFKDTIFVETGNFLHMLYVDPIRVGVCLTNKIDPDNFSQVFNKLFQDFQVSINFNGHCVTKYDRQQWSSQQTVSAYVVASMLLLVTLSTLLEVLHLKLAKLPWQASCFGQNSRTKSKQMRLKLTKYWPIFTSFSLIRNTSRLFSAQDNNNNSMQRVQQHLLLQQSQASGGGSSCSQLAGASQSSSSAGSSSDESSPSIERRSTSITSSSAQLISMAASSTAGQLSMDLCGLGPKGTISEPIIARRGTGAAAAAAAAASHSTEVSLGALHGIRVITMTWMIINHTYMFGGFFVLWAHRRLIDIAEWPKSLSFQLVLNGWLTVETYFFLSAAIIVLNVMPLMKSQRFSYLPYVFHRLLRLLPAYIGLICLNFLWPLASSGPVWLVKGRSFIQWPCENYLWTNFLFVNNWIWPEKQCMVHTWFLSADFQLYLLAPILVYLLYRRPFLGHALNIIVAILASCLSGFVIYANELLPTTLINKLEFDSIKQQLSYSYFATYQHMGPYCLGIFVGYLLYKQPQIRLPKHLTWLLWLLLPPLSFTTLLLTYLWNGAYTEPQLINPSPLISAFYVAIHRTIWTSLVAWLVFACATGRARLLSSFLSHQAFVPLSRLSFSIYLVHMPLIMFRALNLRHTVEWTDLNILWEACGNFIASILLGYFLNVTFESPIINLERAIWGRPSSRLAGGKQQDCSSGSSGGAILTSKSIISGSDSEPSRKIFQPQLGPASGKLTVGQKQQFATPVISCDMLTPADHFELASEADSNLNKLGASAKYPTSSRQSEAMAPCKSTTSEEDDMDMDMQDCISGRQAIEEAAIAARNMMLPRQKLWRNVSSRNNNNKSTSGEQNARARGYQSSLGFDSSAADRLMARYEQQWRRVPEMETPERPAQYATLARTSQFNHQARQQQQLLLQLQQQPDPFGLIQRRQLAALEAEAPQVENANTGGGYDQVGGLRHPTSPMISRSGLGETSLLGQQARRRGRYNTLSSSGAREWRHQAGAYMEALEAGETSYNDAAAIEADRRRRASVDYWRSSSIRANGTSDSAWVPSRADEHQAPPNTWMPAIPRINSNTLRRQQQQQQQKQILSSAIPATAESIAEEPLGDDQTR